MTVKEVSTLTGVSVRTLQFYDEIGLLKPTQLTGAGYRLYDESALEALQRILFFKELEFSLKEIKAIVEDPAFDRTSALVKQRELLRLKRDRLDGLLELLEKLIKGEQCMDFDKFDMTSYFDMLKQFRETQADKIAQRYGSLEEFDALVERMKGREGDMAAQAEAQYGSLESYVEAIEQNLQSFLDHGTPITREEALAVSRQTDVLTRAVVADLSRDPASPEVQAAVGALVAFAEEGNRRMNVDMGERYWAYLAEQYATSTVFQSAADKQYGSGAAAFLGRALRAYVDGQR